MLPHVPSFGQNARGSPDFLVYPVPKACMHDLGTGVTRRLGFARSASSPKAAQALGCSLTPGLRILFGRVTCMAQAASVSGLWALGSLLTRFCGVLATGHCGGHAQASRQAKHCAHRGILMLVSCDKAFQDPCHSETREQKYVQQHIRICTHGVKTGLG